MHLTILNDLQTHQLVRPKVSQTMSPGVLQVLDLGASNQLRVEIFRSLAVQIAENE